jgi:ketosteroid isomerase-like protein
MHSLLENTGEFYKWTFFFTTIPDIQIEILGEVAEGDTVWAEVHYHATRTDGKKFTVPGVWLLGIQADQISWVRLYFEWPEQLRPPTTR